MPDPEHHYLLPVAQLSLTREWEVGRVRFLPAGRTVPMVEERRVQRSQPPPDGWDAFLDERAAKLDGSVVTEVRCAEPREAYEHVSDALAILRLLQHVRYPTVNTDMQSFGLPGQLAQWVVEYIDLLAGPGAGGFSGRIAPGWAFSDEDYDAFIADAGLQFLSAALTKSEHSRLEQRAILGARLLSTSTLEQDPDQKLLAAVMALEVLIGDDKRGPKKLRLARRHSYLACSVPQKSMCGRDRPSCPYLALDPNDKADAKELEVLWDRAAEGDIRVLCSEYYRVIDLYNARSHAVHQGTIGLGLDDVRHELYPIYRWLIPQLYAWYATHPDDEELRQLDAEIRRTAEENPPEPIPAG